MLILLGSPFHLTWFTTVRAIADRLATENLQQSLALPLPLGGCPRQGQLAPSGCHGIPGAAETHRAWVQATDECRLRRHFPHEVIAQEMRPDFFVDHEGRLTAEVVHL